MKFIYLTVNSVYVNIHVVQRIFFKLVYFSRDVYSFVTLYSSKDFYIVLI